MPARVRCTVALYLLVASLLWIGRTAAEGPARDWPTFRGAARTAIAPDTDLLESWPEGGPKLVWQTTGAGRGYSSLAVSGDRVYTLGDNIPTADDQDEHLVCFDRTDGKPLWKTKTGPPWNEGDATWQGSRSTPTVDGDRVYALTPHGELVCCREDGTELWRKDLPDDFGGVKGDGWGYGESVLIDGDKLLCTPGGPTNTLVALDKRTGETIWTTARADDRGAGHASIVISEVDGTRVYVQSTGSGPMGVRADDGKLLWAFDIEPTTAVIPTPIVRDDLVFFVAGYGRGGALLKQVPSGDAELAIEVVYPLNAELGNKHGGVVLVGDYLYGDTEDRGIPYCAELLTGAVQWKSRGAGRQSASLAAADGHLYIHYADGTMTLAEASPKELKETGQFQVPGSGGEMPSWTHPVIADGRLYLREGDVVVCYELRQ